MGSRRFWGALLVAAIAVVALSGCDPTPAAEQPAKPAGDLFAAWKANDHTAAGLVATPTAVTAMFSVPYSAAAGWLFVGCDNTSFTFNYCHWIDNTDNGLSLQITKTVDRTGEKITSVGRDGAVVAGGYANLGKLFYLWSTNNEAATTSITTIGARTDMFGFAPYSVSDHWRLTGCGSSSTAYSTCSWQDRYAHVIGLAMTKDTHIVYDAIYLPHG